MWVNGLFVLCPIEGKLCPITPAAQGSVFKTFDLIKKKSGKETKRKVFDVTFPPAGRNDKWANNPFNVNCFRKSGPQGSEP